MGRAPKRVEKANFPNFEVTFLEILTCRTKTDAGFGISGPKLLGNGIARSILEQQVKFCCLVLSSRRADWPSYPRAQQKEKAKIGN